MEMEDVQISYDTSESQGFVFEFKTFCTILHDNLLKDGKFHQIMTSDVEKGLVQYLLTPQDDASCSEELSNWLQQYVFCVVSNEEQTTFELHIWMDDQKRVASIENYYTMLSSLYSQLGRVTPEYFLKKVNENYALLPEEVTMYFINHCIGHKESKTKAVPKSHENKENLVYGCKIISYEYIKQKVIKRKVLTEVFNKTSGKVVQSKCQEEDPSDDFIYCVQKNEKLCDITNTKRTEVSTTNYTSNQALEVKFLNRTVLAYFPPDEMQNHDHLVTLSDLIYKDQEISSVNTDEIQMEFIVPQKLPEKCMVDLQSIFSTSENKSLFPESDHVYEKSSSKKMKKAVKKPKTTPGNPKIVVNPPGKLTIVTDKNNKGATLKCIPVDFIAETPPQELSYSALSAAAGPAEEPDENDGDGVFNHLENDVTMDDNVTEKMADTISKQVAVKGTIIDDTVNKHSKSDQTLEKNIQEVTRTNDSDKSKLVSPYRAQSIISLNNRDNDEIKTVSPNFIRNNPKVDKSESSITLNKRDGDQTETISLKPNNNPEVHKSDQLTQAQLITTSTNMETKISYPNPINNNPIVDKIDVEPNKEKSNNISTNHEAHNSRRLGIQNQSEIVHMVSSEPTKQQEGSEKDLKLEASDDVPCSRYSRRKRKETSRLLSYRKTRSMDSKSTDDSVGKNLKTISKSTNRTRKKKKKLTHVEEGDNESFSMSATGDPAKQNGTDNSNSTVFFKCALCYNKQFKSKSGYHYHMAVHQKNEQFLCQHCGAAFANKPCLRQHVRLLHLKLGKKNFPCSLCPRVFTSSNGLCYHKSSVHSTTEFMCEICGLRISNKSMYLRHKSSVHGPGQKNPKFHKCDLCDKIFRSRSSVVYHKQAAHTKNEMLICGVCGSRLKSELTLKVHMKIHEDKSVLKCKLCDKQYLTEIALKSHLNIHSGLLPYPCKICDQSFPSVRHRLRHVSTNHTPKQYRCEICQKNFKSHKNFKYHVLTHTGEKPYPCPDCHKHFRSSDLVHVHRKIHSGKMSHVCHVCGVAFVQKGNMTRHIKKYHSISPPSAANSTTSTTTTTTTTNLGVHTSIKKEVIIDYDKSKW